MPKLSIITPSYNSALFITGCIENVASQGADIEHIIVDGGSTDDTVKLLKRYSARYPQIRWISEKDKGQSDAMNKGIAMAATDVIGFLNVDDYYQPGTLNRVIEIFPTVTSPAFVVGNCNIFNHSGRLVRKSSPVGLTVLKVLSGDMEHPVNPAAYFYHKSLHDICGPYSEEHHQMMDVDMLLKILRVANVHTFNEDWGNWRVHRETKSAKTASKGGFDAYHKLLQHHIDLLPKEERASALAARLALGSFLCFLTAQVAKLAEFADFAAPLTSI
jgi:glycosyltransferase involved in cell wall biosynthesis